MTDPISIYLAGPVNDVPDGGHGWREYVKERYAGRDDLEWVDPLDKYDGQAQDVRIAYGMKHEAKLREEFPDAEVVTSHEIVRADKELIRGSDAMLVGWTQCCSVGTPREIEYAKRSAWLAERMNLDTIEEFVHPEVMDELRPFEEGFPIGVWLEPQGVSTMRKDETLSPWMYEAGFVAQLLPIVLRYIEEDVVR